MNGFIRISILFLLILSLAGQTSFAQSAEELMPKAIQLEEVKGELEKAIEVYQTIIHTYPDNKPVAARAYFHMGMCYEKLGKQEAEKAYNTVIKDYTDQEDMVNAAKSRLYALVQATDQMPVKGMSMRKVWEGPDVDFMGEPSPDGKYISYVDWDTGDLAIYETETGKKRRLTTHGTWDDPCEFAEFSRWSPDGKKIVYDWYKDDIPGFISQYIVGLDGKEPLKLWNDEETYWSQCYDWSPDGKYILTFIAKRDSSTHMALISTSDGSMQTLKVLWKGSYASPRNMRFSPDSRLIAYDIPAERGNQARDIYLFSIDGSLDIPLVAHPADDHLLGWAPDGKGILFASDRNGTLSAWIVPIVDGDHFGRPVLIKSDIGFTEPMGFSQKGSYFFGLEQRLHDVYTIDLNPDTGTMVAPAEKAILQFEGRNMTPAYSPDGKYLAYISNRSPIIETYGFWYRGNVLCIKTLKTGKVRELRSSLDLIGYPSWSPDGKNIAVVHWNVDDRIELYEIDVQTGQSSLISKPDQDHGHFGGHGWFPGGKAFYYGLREGPRDQNTGSWNLVVRDLDNGEEKIIYKSEDFYTISLSPDGHWFALTYRHKRDPHLIILSASGEDSRVLYRFKKGVNIGSKPSATWTADGKHILLGMHDPEVDVETFELCRIPVAGGELERLGLKMKSEFLQLNAHPNGRHIAFSSSDQIINEIWVMENFLPESAPDNP
jgi:Tol biopolymer transport system component